MHEQLRERLKRNREFRELEPFGTLEFFAFLELRELPVERDDDEEEEFVIEFDG